MGALKDTPDVSPWSIETGGLEKYFGENRVLRGIDLKVARGECCVIFGPNGAGKTTLLRVLSTLVKPSAGSVWLEGRDIRDNPEQARKRISLVSHQTFLYDNLTVEENLRFYGKMYDIADLGQRISQIIAWVGLESRLHDLAGTLSRGQQQRVAMARASLHDPRILLLDEPEVGLDSRAGDLVRDAIGADSEKRTVVMTTHNLENGLKLADSIAILNRGRIVYSATRQELDGTDFHKLYDHYVESPDD